MKLLSILLATAIGTVSGHNQVESISDFVKCEACSAGTSAAQSYLRSDKISDGFNGLISKGCGILNHFAPFDLHCDAFIGTMGPAWEDVLVSQLDKDRICNEWLHVCSRKKIVEIDLKSEVSEILSEKPENTKDNNYINSLYTSVSG